MPQLENIEAIERRLWSAADQLRANSPFASNQYFLPVMGLVFLRHAYSRFLTVKDEIEANLPTRAGIKRALTKEDFSQKSSIYLRPEAKFDYLVSLPTGTNMARAIVKAMESIEEDYESLRGILPKSDYQELDDEVLRSLLRTLNPEELKNVSGDVFGRIYEYFLTQFANLKAHDDGEFYTPISIVAFMANVLEPESGTVFDPACGSGGMFVQSARVVEQHHQKPAERLTFRGYEKNQVTANLCQMNLAVHGLEGAIRSGKDANTFYNDPLDLRGKCDYVMANPPFNVDEVDAEKVKSDPRLPFGLPGVNKNKKVSNANYLWISYFYSYLNERGRAGFVMSSQASSAGRDEAAVRRKLIESDGVDIMVSIRSNFFYTRAVPCELWFLNRAKPEQHRGKVLMLDARNVYRQVTRKINDFSPEQLQNLLSIVWLYRGESERFWHLIDSHLAQSVEAAKEAVATAEGGGFGTSADRLTVLCQALFSVRSEIGPFFKSQPADGKHADSWKEFELSLTDLEREAEQFRKLIPRTAPRRAEGFDELQKLADLSRDLVRTSDHASKLANRLIDLAEKELASKSSDLWQNARVTKAKKSLEERRQEVVAQLKLVRYFHRQAHWLLERFPEGQLRNVEGLVKLVDHEELAKNDWALTPGQYVGVAPEPEDEDFDFEETLRAVHEEFSALTSEAAHLALVITTNINEMIG